MTDDTRKRELEKAGESERSEHGWPGNRAETCGSFPFDRDLIVYSHEPAGVMGRTAPWAPTLAERLVLLAEGSTRVESEA